MTRPTTWCIGPLLMLLIAAAPLRAQDAAGAPLRDMLLPVIGGLASEDVRGALREVLEDPATLNSLLDIVAPRQGGWRLLQGLDLGFTTFEVDDSDLRGLGLEYDYQRTVKQEELGRSDAGLTTLNLDLSAAGNIAFDREINPRDFLKNELTFALARSRGGAVRTTPELRDSLLSWRRELALITDEAELERSETWRNYLAAVTGHLTTQLYLDVGAAGSLESDQTFSQTQHVYRLRVGADLKAWNRSSRLARWNLFDWPFAAVRYLSGTDPTFTPRGSTFPTVILGLGVVNPGDDSGRLTVGDSTSYPRMDLEVAFKSLVLESSIGQIFFESDLRWFRELGASTPVRAAELDEFTYFAAALTSPDGPYVSWSTGRLPFDARSQQVYELGFKLNF
jgi:hypothetical protein